MSERFNQWIDAHAHAVRLARKLNLNVAIRFVKEFGKYGYNVGLASINDSDYAKAQIVKPSDPL